MNRNPDICEKGEHREHNPKTNQNDQQSFHCLWSIARVELRGALSDPLAPRICSACYISRVSSWITDLPLMMNFTVTVFKGKTTDTRNNLGLTS